jgi:hypothetical protein
VHGVIVQRRAGVLVGLAIGLATVATAPAQQPQGLGPDAAPAPSTQRPTPDPAPLAARLPRTAGVAPTPAPRGARPSRGSAATEARSTTRARPPARPATTRGSARSRASTPARPARRRTRPAAADRALPHLELASIRRAVAFLSPGRGRSRATGSADVDRPLLAATGAALLAVAAAGALTLTRATARTRA